MPTVSKFRNAEHQSLMRSIPGSLALLASCAFLLLPAASAQTHTSSSSGSGHASASASTSHSTSFQSAPSPARTTTPQNSNVTHHARGYWRGGIYYPYAVSGSDSGSATANPEAECQGGPTIFDRCSSTPGNYIPPTNEGPAHGPAMHAAFARPASSGSDSSNPTTLVFKDGHEVEVDNYAVAGQTLYDLTPGRSQKIALSDLDLSATQKQNHDQGALFQLPPSANSN